MARFLRPLFRGTTYTRLLHLWVPMLLTSVWIFVSPETPYAPALALILVGLIPAVRMGEGVQAQLLLTPGKQDSGISVAPSATWRDRGRTLLWLEVRVALGWATAGACVWLPIISFELIEIARGRVPDDVLILKEAAPNGWYALLAPSL